MGKKKQNKLGKKLDKLNREFYGKKISEEDMLVHKFTRSLKEYYNSIPLEQRKALVEYILNKERMDALEIAGLDRVDDSNDDKYYSPKKCRTLSDVIYEQSEAKVKSKKKSKKTRKKRVVDIGDGLLALVNPGLCDASMLGKKKYRKLIRELSDKENAIESVELDCTLASFKKEVMKNDKVNQAVSDAFFNKYGVYY